MQKHRDEIRILLYKTFIYRVRPEKEDEMQVEYGWNV